MLVLVFLLLPCLSGPSVGRAPRGWNSYDNYGVNINETNFFQDIDGLAQQIENSGFDFATIDGGW